MTGADRTASTSSLSGYSKGGPNSAPLLDGSPYTPGKAPSDKGFLVYSIFLLLGAGVFVAWKTFITATKYFQVLYPDTPFEFWFGFAFWAPTVPTQLFMATRGHKWPLIPRLVAAYGIAFLTIVGVAIVRVVEGTDIHGFYYTLVGVVLAGFSGGILFASTFALSARFPHLYTSALMTGQAIAGLLIGALRAITRAAFGNTVQDLYNSSVWYFVTTALLLCMCVASVLLLRFIPFSSYFMKHTVPSEAEQPLMERTSNTTATVSVYRKCLPMAVMVWLNFSLTASCWPGLILDIPPGTQGDVSGWFQFILIVCFLWGDFFGRYLPAIPGVVPMCTPRVATGLLVCRLVFYPLVSLLVDQTIPSHIVAYITVFFYALSNGFVGTLGMIHGSIAGSDNQELAGTVMSGSLNTGIFTGSSLAFALLYVVTGTQRLLAYIFLPIFLAVVAIVFGIIFRVYRLPSAHSAA